MRDFRIQAIINVIYTLRKKELSFWQLCRYLYFWCLPRKNRPKANKFFDIRDFGYFREPLFKLGKREPLWFPRLMEPSTLGIRGWEYSLMFDKIKFNKRSVLDVGPGSSRLAGFLAKSGASVTMLDINKPLEITDFKRGKGLKFVLGDMTKMDFKDNLFDCVICISALEHIDMNGDGFFSEAEYFQRCILALKEMMRVLKPGGDFYLTTEFYLNRQKTDRWVYSDKQIRGAFKIEYLEKMLKVLTDSGLIFDSAPETSPEILLNDPNRANFRGRYISTYSIRGKKA